MSKLTYFLRSNAELYMRRDENGALMHESVGPYTQGRASCAEEAEMLLGAHDAEIRSDERKGTVRLTLEQALNVQKALQRAQHLCEESAGESSGEDTPVYTRDLEALGEALDAIGEVCITDEGWLAAAIKEAQGE